MRGNGWNLNNLGLFHFMKQFIISGVIFFVLGTLSGQNDEFKAKIESKVTSSNCENIIWCDTNSVALQYRNLLSQQFYKRIFDSNSMMLLANVEEPGCCGYEALKIEQLGVTEFEIRQLFSDSLGCIPKSVNTYYCVLSINSKHKKTSMRKAIRLNKFISKNSNFKFLAVFILSD